jgi:hypothetical protein
MNKLKFFLKVAERIGYPNPKILSAMEHMDYEPENFLSDLKDELGEESTLNFVVKSLKKLENYNGSIRIPLEFHDSESWAAVEITAVYFDDNESDIVNLGYFFTDSEITDPETGEKKTIQQIKDDVDMGEWQDIEDFIDYIKGEFYSYILQNTGIQTYWD